MSRPAGYLYVYFTYGMHFCMNAVARPRGGGAVLLRAAELEGLAWMRARRGREEIRELCAGPARLTQALDVSRDLDGADLVDGDEIWIERGRTGAVSAGPRVGVRGDAVLALLDRGDPFVSRGRPGPPTPKATARDSRARSTTP